MRRLTRRRRTQTHKYTSTRARAVNTKPNDDDGGEAFGIDEVHPDSEDDFGDAAIYSADEIASAMLGVNEVLRAREIEIVEARRQVDATALAPRSKGVISLVLPVDSGSEPDPIFVRWTNPGSSLGQVVKLDHLNRIIYIVGVGISAHMVPAV